MHRREFLALTAAASAAALLPAALRAQVAPAPRPQPKIPRWRGFNLTEMTGGKSQPFVETDFQWMSEWGFDFARLPVSYWCWGTPKDWSVIRPEAFQPLDRALALGKQYGVHTCVAMHRIPGYCVSGGDLEPLQLFKGPAASRQEALEAACRHWHYVATRYRDVPTTQLSFDLLNEPPFMADQAPYVAICKALIGTIRAVSPDRLIFANGADIGQTPVLGLLGEGIVQSTHDYQPKMVTHYEANWVPDAEFESRAKPTWPMVDAKGVRWDKEKLRREDILKWKPLTDQGAPVHVGEWGCFTHTPHEVCLRFMADELALWKEAGWGWSMWNLRGGFGIVDSARPDVDYESFRGHRLDRQMLQLLVDH